MAKPYRHALSSARKFGGEPADYFDIHNFLDSSKAGITDARHRALTHNSWFIGPGGPLERAFGVVFTRTSDGQPVCTRDVGEQHIFEDLGLIPTVADYLTEMAPRKWMEGRAGRLPENNPQSTKGLKL